MSLSYFLLSLKGSSKSGNYGHEGRPGKRGGSTSKEIEVSLNLPSKYKKELDRALEYTKSGDISKITSVSDKEFKEIEGVLPKDVAFFNNETKEIIVNELKIQISPPGRIAHEVGHAVMNRLTNRNEESLLRIWDRVSHTLSGNQRHNPSEGLAEIFSMYATDKGRLKRVMNKKDVEALDEIITG